MCPKSEAHILDSYKIAVAESAGANGVDHDQCANGTPSYYSPRSNCAYFIGSGSLCISVAIARVVKGIGLRGP